MRGCACAAVCPAGFWPAEFGCVCVAVCPGFAPVLGPLSLSLLSPDLSCAGFAVGCAAVVAGLGAAAGCGCVCAGFPAAVPLAVVVVVVVGVVRPPAALPLGPGKAEGPGGDGEGCGFVVGDGVAIGAELTREPAPAVAAVGVVVEPLAGAGPGAAGFCVGGLFTSSQSNAPWRWPYSNTQNVNKHKHTNANAKQKHKPCLLRGL